jgi:hypothetical protein
MDKIVGYHFGMDPWCPAYAVEVDKFMVDNPRNSLPQIQPTNLFQNRHK